MEVYRVRHHRKLGSATVVKLPLQVLCFVMIGKLEDVLALPFDEAFELTAAYNTDSHPHKVSLDAGVYRDGKGKPWVLPSVIKVRER